MKASFFSQRTNWNLGENDLTSLLKELESEGVSVIDLTESNPTQSNLSYPTKEILSSFVKPENLIYQPDPKGMLKAREAISRYYTTRALTVLPEQIFLTSSTSEGYSHIFRLMCNPKETVLFPRPSYPLFQFLVDLHDLTSEFYPLNLHEQWGIDFASLEYVIKAKTRGIVLVNPNNPTGNYLKKSELEQLNKMCVKEGLFLISDEVFYDYGWQNDPGRVSLVQNKEVLSFTLSGLSKNLGLPQMKLSWIVVQGPDELVKEACARLEVITDTYLSVNTPAQNAVPEWLQMADQMQSFLKVRVDQNRKILAENIADAKHCQLLPSEGGWYAVLFLHTSKSEEEVVMECLTRDHVLVHPGYFFDFEEGRHIVISLLPETAKFQKGIKKVLERI